MEIIHVSAEGYPVAKAGGLGDVAGALPKYQNRLGHVAKLVMPMYRTAFLFKNEFDVVHKGSFHMSYYHFDYTVIKERHNKLGFDLYLIDINGLLDREKVYGYDDDTIRFLAFQTAFVDWLAKWNHRPSVVHVHDHQAALVPFMMKHCFAYRHLSSIKTILTIHNGEYQGWMDWSMQDYLPDWDRYNWGLLDWHGNINPLACGIKCVHNVNTVSNGYLEELLYKSRGLESLFQQERAKCFGILNGIDTEIWNPKTDGYLEHHFDTRNAISQKRKTKEHLCKEFYLDVTKPLIIFIGRLVLEKTADLLPRVIEDCLEHMGGIMNFLVLGSGEKYIEEQLQHLHSPYFGYYNSMIGYNEQLSHQMYAGADFLLMPSRVEPCGLNQMYAMRYGTIPIVRRTGGLKDTVRDYGEEGGFGVCFDEASVGDISHAVYRAMKLYEQRDKFEALTQQVMAIDHSWEQSAEIYINLYNL